MHILELNFSVGEKSIMPGDSRESCEIDMELVVNRSFTCDAQPLGVLAGQVPQDDE